MDDLIYDNNSRLTYLKRLVLVVFSPVEAIKDISPGVKIILLLPFAIITSILPYIIRYNYFRNYIISLLKTLGISPGNVSRAADNVLISNFVTLPVGALLILVLWSAAIFGMTRLMDGEGSLKQYFALYGYTFSINFIYVCFIIIYSFFSDKGQIDISLYSLISVWIKNLHGFWIGFLKEIDPFKLWKYIIIFLGILYVGKLRKLKSLVIVLILYLAAGSVQGLGEVLTIVTSHLK